MDCRCNHGLRVNHPTCARLKHDLPFPINHLLSSYVSGQGRFQRTGGVEDERGEGARVLQRSQELRRADAGRRAYNGGRGGGGAVGPKRGGGRGGRGTTRGQRLSVRGRARAPRGGGCGGGGGKKSSPYRHP